MSLKWEDSLEIAIELCEKYPEVDPQYIRFTDLHKWICDFDSFEDNHELSSDKIIEAIHMNWIEEAN